VINKAENLSVRLPVDVRQKVDEIARRTRRSRSFIINEAVASYVRAQSDYAGEIAEAVRSAETGVGHSKEQVFAWLDSWANGEKRSIPEPDIL
jgi:RHH-type transcriptional regulator, rel operon repressor / antitoxin RelB